MSDRYIGKPFLRLLDSYVLDVIGALDDANARWLVAAEPNFRHEFGGTGGWRDVVRQRMQFPVGIDAAIRETWEKGRVRYREGTGEDADPIAFAQTFIDTNFPH